MPADRFAKEGMSTGCDQQAFATESAFGGNDHEGNSQPSWCRRHFIVDLEFGSVRNAG